MLTALVQKKNSQKGFTLVELMIAVAIIAILAVIGLAIFGNIQKNARDARRKADITTIAKTLEAYVSNNNLTSYPAPAGTMFAGGIVPNDPVNTAPYTYTLPAAGATFTVCAKLETSTGNYSDAGTTAVPAGNGGFFCLKNQQ